MTGWGVGSRLKDIGKHWEGRFGGQWFILERLVDRQRSCECVYSLVSSDVA
jgi:hypothetical protein